MTGASESVLERPTVVGGDASGGGLRRDCLPLREVVAQSVANVAPTLTPTMNIPLAFASAGNGTWLAYVLATAGMILVGLNINQFARRSSSAGSLNDYVTEGLGPACGMVTGWTLTFAYLLCGVACLCGFAQYWLVLFPVSDAWLVPVTVGLITLSAFLSWCFAYRDIRVSAELMLFLEAGSVLLILVLGVIVMMGRGVVDTAQLHMVDVSWSGMRMGLVLCVFSFVGFESATSLGEEARNPLQSIPRAVLSSTVLCGVFFVLMCYIEVYAFQGQATTLDKSDAPLTAMAVAAGVPRFGTFISVAAMISFFACTLASFNAAARTAYSLGRHHFLHPALGIAHPVHGTPCVSATVVAFIALGLAAIMRVCGMKTMDVYGDVATLSTFGFLLVYLLVSVAAPVALRACGRLRAFDVVLSGVTVVFMLAIMVGSVYPVPDPPMNLMPYIFGAFVLLGVGWYALLKVFASLGHDLSGSAAVRAFEAPLLAELPADGA